MLRGMTDLQRRLHAGGGYRRRPDQDLVGADMGDNDFLQELEKSKITYDPSLNNISH